MKKRREGSQDGRRGKKEEGRVELDVSSREGRDERFELVISSDPSVMSILPSPDEW